ncbi:balbiani ring protein 3 [Phlebotomus papatasi]|uniref:balbiani ring protein 3 n=1 Tax=Phlebotomus papatasi TaxID=29031 RepID=UPI00248462D9|nr:balbiani ring protein 3 [Phlebotomus papatasi]
MKGYTLVLCLALAAPIVLANIREQCEEGNLSPGYYPHSTYCNKFYSCVFETIYEHTCVTPFLWNNDIQNCDYPENVDCGDLVIPQKRKDGVDEEELPQTAQGTPCTQGCPCAQGCVGADENTPVGSCGCGCAGSAPSGGCSAGCPGGCGCGCAGAQGGCSQQNPQQPCPQVPGQTPSTCPCGCNSCNNDNDFTRPTVPGQAPSTCSCGCNSCNSDNDIPRPPVPTDLIHRMAQALLPPRPCGCQNCQGCQSGNVQRPELRPF